MKKKPLAPRAQILWFPVLPQLNILSQSVTTPAGTGDRRGPARAGSARGAPGRHFHTCLLRIHQRRGLRRDRPCPLPIPAHAAPALPQPGRPHPRAAGGKRTAGPGAVPPGIGASPGSGSPARPLPAPSRGRKQPRDAGARLWCAAGAGSQHARLSHSPGAGRGRGLDGADTEPVGRVLQRLQRLLVGFVVILHVCDAGGLRLRVSGGGGWTCSEDGLCDAAARLTGAERWGGERSAGEGRGARGRREERPAPSSLPPSSLPPAARGRGWPGPLCAQRPARAPRRPRLLPRAPFPRRALRWR